MSHAGIASVGQRMLAFFWTSDTVPIGRMPSTEMKRSVIEVIGMAKVFRREAKLFSIQSILPELFLRYQVLVFSYSILKENHLPIHN